MKKQVRHFSAAVLTAILTALLLLGGCSRCSSEELPTPALAGAYEADEPFHPRVIIDYNLIHPRIPVDYDRLAILNSNMTEYEMLRALGWYEDEFAHFARNPSHKTYLLNSMRYNVFMGPIRSSQPIGASGTAIPLGYFGGLRVDYYGRLVVYAVTAAFEDADSMTAIEEMRELGIIVRESDFSELEMIRVNRRLSGLQHRGTPYGAVTWRREMTYMTVQLHPYTPEQIAYVQEFLLGHDFDLAMFRIVPAVTDEM